jgi:hypothetical protein
MVALQKAVKAYVRGQWILYVGVIATVPPYLGIITTNIGLKSIINAT